MTQTCNENNHVCAKRNVFCGELLAAKNMKPLKMKFQLC